MRVPQFLTDQHIAFETMINPPAYTSSQRAKYLRVPGKQLVKSVLLSGPDGYLLAVLPATQHIDLAALAQTLGGPVRLATGAEIAAVFRDCEWGVVVPFGTLYGLPTLLEDTLDPEMWIIFKAHFHAVAIRMRCRDFEQLEQPRRLAFARLQLN